MIRLEKGDCLELLGVVESHSVDLVVMDPPYDFRRGGSGGAFGEDKRSYHKEYEALLASTGRSKETERLRILSNASKAGGNISGLHAGFDFKVLDGLCRVMKKINLYCWCSKLQLRPLLDYFEDKKCAIEVLTWHKTNPIPTCNNTYLSDTEYCIFAREKGVKLYGTYATKRKYYVTPCNVTDKKLFHHPTIKPLDIIKNLIINSSKEGEIVLDPFMGSGTTGCAAKELGRDFIGFELDNRYFEIAKKRVDEHPDKEAK